MLIKYCENLLAKLRECQGTYVKRMVSGSFRDIADYQHVCGIYKGLLEAENMIKDVYNSLVKVTHDTGEKIKEEETNESGFEFY